MMKAPHSWRARLQRGFTAVSAIFILVILTVLGAFIMTVSTNQQIGSAQDLLGVRAYEAARSGIEWGLYQQLRNGSCAASSNFAPPAPTLAGFTVTVTCTTTAGTNGGPTTYTVQSTACNQPGGGTCPNVANPGDRYIERRLDVRFN